MKALMKYLMVFLVWILILAAMLLELFSAESPIIASETPRIQAYISEKLQHPVEIKSVSLAWHGVIPVIQVNNFTVYTLDHKQILFHVGEVLARVKIIDSLLNRRVQLSYLYVNYLNLLFAKENNSSQWHVVNLEFLSKLFSDNLSQNFSDQLTFEGEHLGLGFQTFFPDYLSVQYVKAKINLTQLQGQTAVKLKNIQFYNKDFNVSGEAEYVNQSLQFQLSYDLFSSVPAVLKNYLPQSVLDADVLNWLVGAVKSFDHIRGNISLLNNHVTARFNVKNLKLLYEPSWPLATKLNADFIFTEKGMDANVSSALLSTIPLSQIHVSIPDFNKNILNIQGEINTQGKLMLHYVLHSPLKDLFGEYFQHLDWSGNARLKTTIDIPLEKNDPSKTKVTGEVAFTDNDLMFYNKFHFTQAAADIQFTEKGLSGKKITARYQGDPVNIGILPQRYEVSYKQYRFNVQNKNKSGIQININQPNMAGEINYQFKKIMGKFRYFYIISHANPKAKFTSNNKSTISPDMIPESMVTIDDFRYNTKRFGQVKFKTIPQNNGLKLTQLKSVLGQTQINFFGTWTKNQSTVEGTIVSHNLSQMLTDWNVSNNIRSPSAKFTLKLNWFGALYQPDIQTLSGNIGIQIDSADLMNVGSQAKTDFGHLITLLSFQSLAKRLQLDFSDLRKSGLNFDSITGNFVLNNGIAKTNNLVLEGSVASIAITGAINIISQTYNLTIVVTPHLTSSLPVIATIAGGPVAGAATWAAGKLFNPLLNKITNDQYTVTGSWDNPLIKPI